MFADFKPDTIKYFHSNSMCILVYEEKNHTLEWNSIKREVEILGCLVKTALFIPLWKTIFEIVGRKYFIAVSLCCDHKSSLMEAFRKARTLHLTKPFLDKWLCGAFVKTHLLLSTDQPEVVFNWTIVHTNFKYFFLESAYRMQSKGWNESLLSWFFIHPNYISTTLSHSKCFCNLHALKQDTSI